MICEICPRPTIRLGVKTCLVHLCQYLKCHFIDCECGRVQGQSYFCNKHNLMIARASNMVYVRYWTRVEIVGVALLNISTSQKL